MMLEEQPGWKGLKRCDSCKRNSVVHTIRADAIDYTGRMQEVWACFACGAKFGKIN